MNVTLRQLRAFVSVARLGSFVHAATPMFLTQAALSHLIRELESSVGVRLLDRTTRSVRLSKAGEIYLPYAERVLSDMAGAALCAKDLRDGKLGSVRVAATHLLSSMKLPAQIAAYRTIQPDTRLILVDASADTLISQIAHGDVDLALGPERPLTEDVVAEHVFSDDLMLVCAAQHRLAALTSVPWQSLAQESFIVAGPGAALRTMLDIHFALTIEPEIEVEHFTTALALAAAGQGITVTTAYVRPFLALHDLRMIPLVEPGVRRRIMLYRHASRALSPAAEKFSAFLLQQLAEPGAHPPPG